MYDWLTDSLGDSNTVVTANRRLARLLGDEFGAQQLQAGRNAWRSPAIRAWQDWLVFLMATAVDQDTLPTRINAHQSQWLWERCLRKEVGASAPSIASLVKSSRDTWQRLADWQVSIGEIARMAQNADQRMFAVAAGRYLGILERENWIDDAGLGSLVLHLILAGRVSVEGRHTFAGFDRQRPIAIAIHEAIRNAGIEVCIAPLAAPADDCSLQVHDNCDAEMRAAGAWARRKIDEQPLARIAIIATELENDAARISRMVREGVTPGWQYGHPSLFDAVNVSYGRRLSEFPAVAIALLLLRWIVKDLSATEVSMLLRSELLAAPDLAGRSRLELRLRQLPDRKWSPAMITAALHGRKDGADGKDWLAKVTALSQRRRKLQKTASPAEWAVYMDETLRAFDWPGHDSLDSAEFQLINRWRDLLNEFARLDLVSPSLGLRSALVRLELLAGDTIFQPESTHAVVQLMGPLEASGAEFDSLWITGLTTANWPPAGSPTALVSRRLQEKFGMPDSTPADTLQYSERVLTRLLGSAGEVVCSYALAKDDTQQSVSDLLLSLRPIVASRGADPGLHAVKLLPLAETRSVKDRVPPVVSGEIISGGAGTIRRQLADPVAAFVHGRMSARLIYPQAVGIPALLRGNLVHDALCKLYGDLPTSDAIQSWCADLLTGRIDDAVAFAFARSERHTDAVLDQLLAFERRRVSALLRQLVAIDGARGEFKVVGVEGEVEFVAGNVRLPLRFDRIDRFADDSIAILDYKTGAMKQLLNRSSEVQEIQLFVYASAIDDVVAALALVNIDSREVVFAGAGRGYTDEAAWPDLLQRIKHEVAEAAKNIAAGDVRINIEQGIKAARPLNLLSRYTELRRDSE
ncbi:MAG: PD-(D/E)XK nuclease family protein [Proteobacteria bacterium]|nr:PD-(D/E)XK nuclease family protein [Pseudomonadota bacterium]